MLANLFQNILEKLSYAAILAGLAWLWSWLKPRFDSSPPSFKKRTIISLLVLVTAFVVLEAVWYETSPTRFDIRMTQIDGGIGPWPIKQDQTFGYMTISIVNTGSPTALLGWHMQLKTEAGKLYDGENTWVYTPTNPPAPLDQIILRGKENSPSRTLYRSDLLPVKTVRQVIGTGAEVEGFLLAVFNVPHGPATGQAQMIVTVADARGQKYNLESTSVVPGDAMDVKGITGMGPP